MTSFPRVRGRAAAGLAAAALVAAPAAAIAANGYATANVHIRSGPSTEYRILDTIPDGARVTIHGCVDGYRWCDTTWRGERGWVYGAYLDAMHQRRRRPVARFGAHVELPIVEFTIGSYWDRHYRDRPWYRDRRGPRRDRARGPGRQDPGRQDPGRGEPNRAAQVSFSPNSGPPGTPVRVRLRGYPPRSRVEIGASERGGNMTIIARGRTNARGALDTRVRIPRRFRPGDRVVLGARVQGGGVRDRTGVFRVQARRGRRPGNDRVTVSGRLTSGGVECQAMRGRNGRLYTLTRVPDRFDNGDRVQVQGEIAEASFCQQGTTINVERMRRQ